MLQSNLIARTKPYVEGSKDEYVMIAMKEAERLSKAAFAADFLHAIG